MAEKKEEGLSFEEMTELLKPLIKTQEGKEITVKETKAIGCSVKQ